jgi:hypothetical protein
MRGKPSTDDWTIVMCGSYKDCVMKGGKRKENEVEVNFWVMEEEEEEGRE